MLKRGKSGNPFPPAPSMNGYRYYFGEEQLVRKGVFCGSGRFEKEFPPGMSWPEMRGHIKAYEDLETAVRRYFELNPGRDSVEVFR